MSMFTRMLTGLFVTLSLSATAEAVVVVTYEVEYGNIDGMGVFTPNAGPVTQGTTIDWRATATITADVADNNLGIAASFLNLTDMNDLMVAETFNLATVNPDFITNFYTFPQEGTPNAGSLIEFGNIKTLGEGFAGSGQLGAGTAPAPVLIATGSYTLTSLGNHNLILSAGSENTYFNTPGQMISDALPFDQINFVNDSILVVPAAGVPEPSSMLLATTLLGPGLIAVRRRRRRATKTAVPA